MIPCLAKVGAKAKSTFDLFGDGFGRAKKTPRFMVKRGESFQGILECDRFFVL
jgi:RNase P/RNase MRP subunit POP5